MKICPKCSKDYDVEMSFCLEDGEPLIVNPEADTVEKLGHQDAVSHQTSAETPKRTNATPETNQIPQMTTSTGHAPGQAVNTNAPKRSYLGILVLLLSLALVFVIAVVGIAGVWWYLQTMDNTVSNEEPASVESTTKPTTTATQKKGAVTKENFQKLKTGMTYKQVVEILGEEGDEMSTSDVAGYKISTYMWSSGMFSNVTLTFRNNKLQSKFQMGLK